jgi:hypothetical protein
VCTCRRTKHFPREVEPCSRTRASCRIDAAPRALSPRPHLDKKPQVGGAVAFILVLAAGLAYAAHSIATDIGEVGEHDLAVGAFVLLGIALLIALGFEFVNGFHDTAPRGIRQKATDQSGRRGGE